MKLKVEELPAYRIAYIRRLGAYGAGNVEVMEKLKSWANAKGLYDEDSIILAIIYDDPQIVKEENCRYDACITITNNYKIDHDNNIKDGNVSGGKYAVFFQVPHTQESLQKAWAEVFPELQSQDIRFDSSKPIIERYKVKMVNNHFCEICVPIIS